MKAELTFPPEMVDEISAKVVERLRPLIVEAMKVTRDDEILTIDEVANLLKVSKAQVYQWVNNAQHGLGDFPYFKAGKLLRFSKKEIIKWLEKR